MKLKGWKDLLSLLLFLDVEDELIIDLKLVKFISLDLYFLVEKLNDEIMFKEWKSLLSCLLDEELNLFVVYEVEDRMLW